MFFQQVSKNEKYIGIYKFWALVKLLYERAHAKKGTEREDMYLFSVDLKGELNKYIDLNAMYEENKA